MKPPLCILCGRANLGDKPFIGPLCIDCFLKRNKLLDLPERTSFDYCRSCGSARIGFRWVPTEDIEDASIKHLEYLVSTAKTHEVVERYTVRSITPLTKPSWHTLFRVRVAFTLKGVEEEVTQDYNIEVYARPSLCPACADAHGGDYNVLLQVRGEMRDKLQEILDRIFSSPRGWINLVDVVETKDGVDIYLRDRGVAEQIIREIRKHTTVEVKRSSEDVGVTRTGRMRRRLTISLRILSWRSTP